MQKQYAICKNLVNAHRKWTRLRNKFLKNSTETNRVCFNQQSNFCVDLLRKTKKWLKPLLLDIIKSSEQITLVLEDKIITNDENAKILNLFFLM